MKVIPATLAALFIVSAGQASAAELAGRWSQTSSGKELVLQPKFKLQPNVASTYGTSLGGSVGYGSMTKTTIVTEAVPMQVDRRMELVVAPDRSFTWTIQRRQHDSANCSKVVRQVKRGRISESGSSLIFAVSGGTEEVESACGGAGSKALPPSRESYAATFTGNRMLLSGGATRWTFTRN